MFSSIEENYLKALYNLSDEKGEVSTLSLSQSLDIKMPTVNSMMKKFLKKGLVYYQSYKPIRLTEKGKKEAALILRKHRLTEMYLVEKMGFNWEDVHEVAEQIEHIHSEKFFNKMDELLDFPKLDPHGSPIPDKQGNIEWVRFKKLNEYKIGEIVELSAIIHSSKEFLKYLNSKNFNLGIKFQIESVEEFDGSVTVLIVGQNRTEVLSNLIAEKLLVKKCLK
ncbi:iron (metal) dependent repressor, DtxR family [Apibacter mensalis]|uniref:Transcriptional regulator MntR n=1 Tax=Apibacter mensalis TaxID=1586267 RepID=A0A0X3AMJ6_9FLAO|nr:metal-dependent transcriptional regulator [Apibacter mensalis]CVK15554.1 iron (metal) dependent repressor, DtxR family [Apibacter mensalis]